MTTLPQPVVNGRRIAGVLLVFSAVATVIALVLAIGWWSTLPRTVTAAPGTPTSVLLPTPISAPIASQPAPSPLPAQDALQQQVDRDRPYVEQLISSWVPQVSSKTVGLTADGITYGYDEILADFNSLKMSYPEARLLRSDDYSVFTQPGYWVTIIPISYASGVDANYWCDSQGIDSDNCFAKLLSHTVGSQGSTRSRK